MIQRKVVVALIAGCAMTSQIEAQSSAAAAGAIAVGYGVLSIGAMITMASMPSDAVPEPGKMIRVGGSGMESRVGRVVTINDGRLIFETDGGQTSISTDSLASVEVGIGNGGRWAQGWGVGFLTGAGIGGLIGLASGNDPPGTFIRLNAGQKALIAGTVLGVGGSVVGTVIGLLAPERWVPATRPSAASRVSINPIVGSRVGLSAKIAF